MHRAELCLISLPWELRHERQPTTPKKSSNREAPTKHRDNSVIEPTRIAIPHSHSLIPAETTQPWLLATTELSLVSLFYLCPPNTGARLICSPSSLQVRRLHSCVALHPRSNPPVVPTDMSSKSNMPARLSSEVRPPSTRFDPHRPGPAVTDYP